LYSPENLKSQIRQQNTKNNNIMTTVQTLYNNTKNINELQNRNNAKILKNSKLKKLNNNIN
jgi:hypothetical protein